MDIAARLAAIRAKKEAERLQATETNAANQEANQEVSKEIVAIAIPEPVNLVTEIQNKKLEVATNMAIGTTRTSEIDHLSFLTKHQELAEAIQTQHPRMPVLLMDIHKHLREDPELVTTLNEEQIAVIVNGLKIQTKTELAGTIVKQSKSRDKKMKLDADMF